MTPGRLAAGLPGCRVAAVVAKLRETSSRMGSGNAVLNVFARLFGEATGNCVRLVKYLIVAQLIGSDQRRSIRSDPGTVFLLVGPLQLALLAQWPYIPPPRP